MELGTADNSEELDQAATPNLQHAGSFPKCLEGMVSSKNLHRNAWPPDAARANLEYNLMKLRVSVVLSRRPKRLQAWASPDVRLLWLRVLSCRRRMR